MKSDLKALAADTLAILERGRYVAPSGREVTLDLGPCVQGTRTWTPAELARLARAAPPRGKPARITVTDETTAIAARRLAATGPVLALNFASAVSTGGGFLNGAKAQEEDLCRCSALFACLSPQAAYYAENRKARSDLYTDHMILSPSVPFFRDDRLALLEAPFVASILTAPAPCNRRLEPAEQARLPEVFARRTEMLLALAHESGHRRLVLGAWGCGAFRNDPALVADVFAKALVKWPFEEVVFGVWDPSPSRANYTAFHSRLG